MSNVKDFSNLSVEEIVNILPHGFGFNGDWEDTEIENSVFKARMIYEHMNENGMYDFDSPFIVKIPLRDALNFTVTLDGNNEQNRLAEEDDLVTYFEDCIATSLCI